MNKDKETESVEMDEPIEYAEYVEFNNNSNITSSVDNMLKKESESFR